MTQTQNKNTPYAMEQLLGIPRMEISAAGHNANRSFEAREREVNSLYALYTETMKKPKILEWHEFERFLPLFKEENRHINPYDEAKVLPLKDLSMEFMDVVTPFKSYFVRYPDGTMVEYPPILTPVNLLADEFLSAVDIADNIYKKCVDMPWKRDQATKHLLECLYLSQNPEIYEYQREKYNRIMTALKERFSQAETVPEQQQEPVAETIAQPTVTEISFDFVPDV
jgi:hypothetical protein